MDVIIQTILIVSVVLLTAVFLAAGIFVIMVLREVKKGGEKINQILTKADQAVDNVNQSLSVLPQLSQELRDSAKVWGVVKFGLSNMMNFLEKKGVIAFKKFSQTAEENEQDQTENSSDLPTGAENDQEDKKTSSRRRFFFKKS